MATDALWIFYCESAMDSAKTADVMLPLKISLLCFHIPSKQHTNPRILLIARYTTTPFADMQKLPNAFKKAAHFLDLPDFLTSKATGNFSRSLCSLVCKFTYDATSVRNTVLSEFPTNGTTIDCTTENVRITPT